MKAVPCESGQTQVEHKFNTVQHTWVCMRDMSLVWLVRSQTLDCAASKALRNNLTFSLVFSYSLNTPCGNNTLFKVLFFSIPQTKKHCESQATLKSEKKFES